jgi:hypothetical protein
MRKALKILLWTVGIIVLLLILLVIFGPRRQSC